MKLFKYQDFITEEARNKQDKLYFYSGRIFRVINLKEIFDEESLVFLEHLQQAYEFDDWARVTFVTKEKPVGKTKKIDKGIKMSLQFKQTTFYQSTKGKEGTIIDDEDFIFTDDNDNTIYLYVFDKNKNDSVRGGNTRQLHGFNYERGIKTLNKLSVKDAYTSRWDAKGKLDKDFIDSRIQDGFSIIEKKGNKKTDITDFSEIDSSFKGDYLWNIKNIKSGAGIDMGDLLRISGLRKTDKGIEKIQYTTPMTYFMLCIGFWEGEKDNIIDEYIIHMSKSDWEQLLPDFVKRYLRDPKKNTELEDMYDELPQFRTKVKTESTEWHEFIDEYLELSGDSIIRPRFKRDSKGQLRIQAGISNTDFIQSVLTKGNYLHFAK